jgi:ribonuclease HI
MSNTLIAYIDGAIHIKNPGGLAAWGFLVLEKTDPSKYCDLPATVFLIDNVTYSKVCEKCGLLDTESEASNNVGEYEALVKLLEYVNGLDPHPSELIIRCDSQLVVCQMKGEYQVKKGLYVDTYISAMSEYWQAQDNGVKVVFEKIRGDDNLAHKVCQAAYKEN